MMESGLLALKLNKAKASKFGLMVQFMKDFGEMGKLMVKAV